MITINFDSKTKTITIDTKAKLDNGGAGSGYWGHAGRPGKVGGSAEDKSGKKISKKKKIDQKQQHRIERADYGKRLRELSEVFGGTNVGGGTITRDTGKGSRTIDLDATVPSSGTKT